jgi:translocation and assembly module TamB
MQDAAARTHQLRGEVSYQPEQIAARLTTVQLESPDGTWRLAQPTRIVQAEDSIVVEHLRMLNKEQRILLAGRLALSGKQDLRLQIDRVTLAALQPLLPPQPEVAGLLSARAQVGGTAAAPRLTSTLELTDLQIAGQEYAGLDASVGYEHQQASLALTVQQDATHTLTATGTLPAAVSWADGWQIEERGELNLRVHSAGVNLAFLNAFTGQTVQEVAGEFRVDMTVRGPLDAPSVSGQLRVPEATLRPELEFLRTEPVKRDETIVVVPVKRSPEPASAPTRQEKKEAPALPQDGMFTNLALDVNVVIPRNTWIRHSNADIELSGEVAVRKQQAEDLVLIGTIETVRGWVAFQGRRFTLTQGQVVFTGGSPIDPMLNIVAQYRLPDYQVEISIGGSLQQPTLTLQSDPVLEQADILALLIFGKPISQLGQGEKIDLQKQALDLTGGYAAAQIAESVADALGLEELGIDLRQVDLTGGRVGFGRYLGPNTYLSVSQEIAKQGGHEVSVEYHLTSDWKIVTSTSSSGGDSVDIVWQKRY